MKNQELYQRIKQFDINGQGSQLTFTKRLARENGWSHEFASRVVNEYLKFAYLATTSTHPITPSEEVDQAWHLHMLYTQSYWEDFCNGVLGKRLEHNPTKGGAQEGEKFNDWYSRTLEAYEVEFGTKPPADIWPDHKTRFGKAAHYVRIDTSENLVISKKRLKQVAALTGMAAALTTGVGCIATSEVIDISEPLPLILIAATAILTIGIIVYFSRKSGGGSGGNNGGSGYVGCGGGCGSSGKSSGDSGSDSGGGDSGGSGCGSSGCGGGGCGGGGCGS